MKPKKILKMALTPRCSMFHACSSGGVALAGAIMGTAFLSASIAFADESWDGDVDTDWNTPANWTNNSFPAGAWAILNTTGPNIATISANSAFTPSDIQVGMATSGRLDHVAGTAQTGAGNWMSVGYLAGGTGTYNLADTGGSGGTLTGFATGSGTMNAQSNLMIGRDSSVGTVNVNTSGQLNVSSDLRVGVGGGTGTLNIDAGIVVTNNWTTLGGGGSSGTVNISGGELRKQGGGNLIVGDNGTGTLNQTGGLVSANSEFWIGQGGTSDGEYNLDAGTLATSAWSVVGREGGTGVMNMTGGTWNHTPGGQHIVIAASGTGTVNLGGGLMNIQNASTEVGENGTAFLTVSGSGELRTQAIRVAMNSGSNGTLSLDGGTVRTGRISGLNRDGIAGDGTSSAFFNGSQIIATADNELFLTSFDSAEIEPDGLLVDSDGFALAGDQALGGTGGIVKSGVGSLSLLSGHSYSGTNTVEAGKLTLPNHATGTGDIQVDAGASLGIGEVVYNSQLSPGNVTFDAASTLDVSFTDLGGSIPTNAPLNVTTNLALGGDLTINVSDVDPETGTLPLIAYAAKSGAGVPVLGLLPENVSGTLQDSGSLISLDITFSTPLAWDGDTAQWAGGATNWYDEETSTDNVAFADGRWVNFDDLATGTTDVILDTVTVQPAGTLFENSTLDFTVSGSGSIGGSGRLIKRGDGTAAISTANTYTGTTRIEEGVLSISSVANGGAVSAIGASSSAPENLMLAGGTLSFTGASGSSDRGFRVEAFGSAISVDNDLGFSGTVVAAPESNLTKVGAGALTLSASGTNTYGRGTIPADDGGLVVDEGSLTLAGAGTHAVTGELQVATLEGVSADLVIDTTTVTTTSWMSIGRGNDGGVATVTATDSTVTTANLSAGYNATLPNNDGDQTITLNGTTEWSVPGSALIADSPGSETQMTLNDSAQFTLTGINECQIGRAGTAVLTINDAGSFTSSAWTALGRFTAVSSGTVNVNGGSFQNVNPDRRIIVGEQGIGVLNIAGGSVSDAGGQTNIGQDTDSNGTVNLMTGGSLTANRLVGGAGASAFHFDGGTLVAASANNDFLTVQTATVSGNGGSIDTNGFDVTVNQVFSGAGGLTKTGAGTLTLNGASTNTGATIVSQGVLKGTGSLPGGLQVNASASVNPGNSAGTMSTGDTTISGTYVCEIDGAAADRLDVAGTLTLSSATIDFNELSAPTEAVYIIASYTTLAGTFTEVDVPSGYSVDYNYLSGNQIALVSDAASFYATWAATNAPTGSAADDYDGDGVTNGVEWLLGGDAATNDLGKLPTVTTNATSLTLTFVCDEDALTAPDTSVEIEVGTTLASWPTAFTVPTAPVANNPGVTVVDNTDGTFTVTLVVLKAADTEKFARLKVTID